MPTIPPRVITVFFLFLADAIQYVTPFTGPSQLLTFTTTNPNNPKTTSTPYCQRHRSSPHYALNSRYDQSRGKPDNFISSLPVSVPQQITPSYADETTTALSSSDDDIIAIEKEVEVKAREKLDYKAVTDVLTMDPESVTIDDTDKSQIGLAAGLVASLGSLFVFHSLTVAAVLFLGVWFIALGDPLDESGMSGALARVVGRTTLKSVRASQPKIQSVARAALVDVNAELEALRKSEAALYEENVALRQELEIRQRVDDIVGRYTAGELKEYARRAGVVVSGNKSELLRRLIEGGYIDVNSGVGYDE